MNRTARLQSILKLAALLGGAATALPGCASYQNEQQASAGLAAGNGGADAGGDAAGGSAGLDQTQGGGGSAASGGIEQSGTGGTVDGTAGAMLGGGGAVSVAGGGATSTGGGGSAGAAGGSAGSGGTAGTTGTAGSNGNAGQAGSGGGAGGPPVVDTLLSQGKTSSANSEQIGNLAPAGNDGTTTSRWCAADSGFGYHWQVDLGQSYTLAKIHILWEKSALYQYKVEGSIDNAAWVTLLDETKTTNTSADQTYSIAGGPSDRWVRITVTNLPNTTTWASFFEFQVYGH
jgi:hypothetical protein